MRALSNCEGRVTDLAGSSAGLILARARVPLLPGVMREDARFAIRLDREGDPGRCDGLAEHQTSVLYPRLFLGPFR